MPARLLSLFARRPPAPDGSPDAVPAGVDGAPVPAGERVARVAHPAAMRRERRSLLRRREIEIRDIGGLALEMVRRDRFRPDLLIARCTDVIAIEERIHELDALLAAVQAAPRAALGAETCRCGAPILRGAHFCSHCGRPAAATPPVVACEHCGQPLPADVNFCAFCGNPVADEEYEPGDSDAERTMVAPWSAEERAGGS